MVFVEARRLIESSEFGPETLAVLFQAFNSAWGEIAHHFDPTDNEQVNQARMRLARAVLMVARPDCNDPVTVKNEALQAMALAGGRLGS